MPPPIGGPEIPTIGVLKYGIYTLDRSGLGGLVVWHPGIGGETQVQFLV